MSIGKRVFAWVYHHLMSNQGQPDMRDPFTRDVRAPLVRQARGDVLEIGAGDGSNLPLYADDVRLTLLEPNPYMIRYLEQACIEQNGVTCVSIVEGWGERLPFPDAHFDSVITTHVLCSVVSQRRVLSEVQRVLRPGGQFLFLEHVAAHPETATYRWQRTINPAWKWVGDGCHLTRDTGAAIQTAGFFHVDVTRFEADAPAVVSPHIVGTARM